MTKSAIPQGDVLWISLDSTQESAIKKTRPCLVLVHDTINRLPYPSAPAGMPEGRYTEGAMVLYEIIWKERFVEKLAWKHGVSIYEVEEVLLRRPYARRAERGRVPGEDLYAAFGQTAAGRYLAVFFVHKRPGVALPISARDMSVRERRSYERREKN